MEYDILFDNEEERGATERVLASVRIKTLSKELDLLISEIIKISNNLDNLLEENKLGPRYLERIGTIENLIPVHLDDDLNDIDFRVKEIIEDLIKRINTRINLVKNSEVLIVELKETYSVDEDKILEDINLARLNKSDFIEE
ncbi:MAG: hypothetical protein PHG03_01840 [Bacilli bacterium]|nr:hypothetical protein [Bacilli bacterium]MDD4795287.1 hypothetical protein [Bacilli bacterium]